MHSLLQKKLQQKKPSGYSAKSQSPGWPVGERSHSVGAILRPKQGTVPVIQRIPFGADNETGHPGSTLPYRQATELMECLRIMGEENRDYCRQEVLGEAPPQPSHVNIPGISTPQPFGTRANAAGATSLRAGGVDVVFLPDAVSTDPAMANRAQTSFSISAYSINYQASGGRVTSFTGPGATTITIVTTYGSGVSASSSSGYGRGTTAADVQAGNTSLGFHEGRHGLDFMQFLAANPFPQFSGATGMTVQAFGQAMQAYANARQQFNTDMDNFSETNTDCVGTTIDQYNAANGQHTTICQQTP